MNKVENLFIEKAIDVCGIIVYSKKETLDFIEACRNFEIGILGIDAFFIAEKMTQPRMEDSINYSRYTKDKNIYYSALEFISERDDNLFFEIVCDY
ncbi:hypothetical protein [Chitinophaga sp.]|uniref:hypothetical protein n=1 Tax=Chitinophaga sp. TaxID=1869181 RepID=UPI0031D9B7C2